MVDSLTLGMPAMPSSALTSPSCMAPRPLSAGSSSCSASSPPARRWYCSALRIIPAETTGLPSSVKAIAPSSRSSAISVSSSPRRPLVIEAVKATGTRASRTAASRRARSMGALSTTGSVLGIATTAQKPPAAAARVPVSRSSLCSWPGTRRCTWGSTKAGSTWRPCAVDDLGALGHLGAAGGRELDQPPVEDDEVEGAVDPLAGVEDVGAAHDQARGGDGGAHERHAGAFSCSGRSTRAGGCAVMTS